MKNDATNPWVCRLRGWCAGLILGVVMMGLAGCSAGFRPSRAKTVTVAQLRTIRRQDTTDYLAYMGEDAHYHYVQHFQLGGGETFRIPISEWHPRRTFPLGQHEVYVLLHSDVAGRN